MNKKSNNDNMLIHQSIHDWVHTNRLYEVQFFYYCLIVAFWIFVGMQTFGLEIQSLSHAQNLLLNFMYFWVLCGLMIGSVWLFCQTYEKEKYNKYINTLNQQIQENLNDDEKEIIWEVIEKNGFLLPQNAQRWALLFLGCCWLFELFFITSWVKDLKLIWTPNWVMELIEWVRANTDFVSDPGVNHQLFGVNIKPSDTILYQMFPHNSERAFLSSDFGASTALFQIWRSFTFPFIFIAFSIILWKPLDWLGFRKIDPQYICGFSLRSIRSFIFATFATLGMSLLLFGNIFRFFASLNDTALLIFDINNGWLGEFFWYFSFIFSILAVKLIYGWLVFWKDLITHIIRLITN